MSAPQPHKTISCQQVLSDRNCTHGGWLRKRTAAHEKIEFFNKIVPWTNMYVCLSQGCVYLYPSDTATKPQHPFSLFGYDRILQAGEISQRDVPWPFKLVPVRNFNRETTKKVRYFSCGSEKEQKIWMTEIKKQMMFANGKGMKVSHSIQGDDDTGSVTLSAVQEPVYTDADDFRPGDQAGEDSGSQPRRFVRSNSPDGSSESDSGEEYNHIQEWEMNQEESGSNSGRGRHDRPLPPPPGAVSEPSKRGRKMSEEISVRGRLPSPPPTGSRTNRSPGGPPSRRQELPPTPPDSGPPDHSPPPTPVARENTLPVSGNISSRIAALGFNNNNGENKSEKPAPPNKPSQLRGGPKFGVKLPFGSGPPPTLPSPKSPPADQRDELPTPPNRLHKPLPPPPALSQRGKGDGINKEESEDEFIRSIYMPDITREQASSLVGDAGEEGVYLLRSGSGPDNDYVLVVYAEEMARKYKVSKSENKVFLVKDTQFSGIRELIEYYQKNDIPLRNTPLTRPYKR